jgi:bifunctional NMN adenylyltransferase/nudix hydrolase
MEHNSIPDEPLQQGILIGRFNPLHDGHLALIRWALSNCTTLFIVIGSDQKVRTMRNLFFSHEREEMINASLTKAEKAKIVYVYLSDYNNSEIWRLALKETLNASESFSKVVPTKLFGFSKDDTSYYLEIFPEYTSQLLSECFSNGANSTAIRKALLGEVYDEANPNKTISIGALDDVRVNIELLISIGCSVATVNWLKSKIEEERIFDQMYLI